MYPQGEMLINGFFIGGPCDQSVGKAVIRSPYDQGIVGTAAEGDLQSLQTALLSAKESFQSWSKSTKSERQSLLRSIASVLRENQEELVRLAALEIGKPVSLAQGEVERAANTFDHMADAIGDYGHFDIPSGFDLRANGAKVSVGRFPRGVVFGVVPFNWPFNLTAHKVAPAIASGSAIVIKASPKALLTTFFFGRLLHEAGVPSGVVNVLSCPNQAVVDAIQNPIVRNFSFTGSDAVGWKLKDQAWSGCHVTLELGGNGFCVVMEDANIEDALIKVVNGAYGYAGQVCIKVQHVLVQDSVYQDVKARLIELTGQFPTGDPRNPQVLCGPVIDEGACDRIQSWIEEATQSGATILLGNSRKQARLAPTLMENVPDSTRLGSQEVFGPVLCIEPIHSLQNAIERVNASRYGIHAGIFTHSEHLAREFYDAVEVGGVIVNNVPTFRLDHVPYGGEKRSGFGREGTLAALDDYTYPKSFISFP